MPTAPRLAALEWAALAIELPDCRFLDDSAPHAVRLRTLHARQLGSPEQQIADLLGVARETVCRWWTASTRGGPEAVPFRRTGRPTGPGRTLTPEPEQRLQHVLDTQKPEDLGIASPLWTRRAVAELIEEECGITMPVRTAGLYRLRRGYAPQRPRRHARTQVPADVRPWLGVTYPGVAARAEQEGADIWWGDETGLNADAYRGRGYARPGQAPEEDVSGGRRRVHGVSAITAAGDVRFMTYTTTMTAAVSLAFLAALAAAAPRKVALIVGRLQAHLTAEVMDWLADHRGQITPVAIAAR